MRQSPARALRVLLALTLAAGVFASAACRTGSERPAAADQGRAEVIVASFSFAESHLLAEIYAQALEAIHIPVRREMALGPRELVLPALQQRLVDVVPEYLGSALTAIAPSTTVDMKGVDMKNKAAVHEALERAIRPWDLQSLTPAAAASQNGFAITSATAQWRGLKAVSDLRTIDARLSFAGTPECRVRNYCLAGLRDIYGIEFGHFVPLESETQRIAALEQGVVDVSLVFTTDGRLAVGDLVLLADDRGLQPAENVVPIVSSRVVARYGRQLVEVLDDVSARLTTQALTFLNWRVSEVGKPVEAEARGWLRRHGLLAPTR